MNIATIEKKLTAMLSPKRLSHSKRVSHTAVHLAKKFGADEEKAALAGILHDCAREFSGEKLFNITKALALAIDDVDRLQPVLLHAGVGAHIAEREFLVSDQEVLNAIKCHTIGGKGMGLLEKIIYLADFIEPERTSSIAVKLREILLPEIANSLQDVDKAMLLAYESAICHTISKHQLLHTATVEGRNELLILKAER